MPVKKYRSVEEMNGNTWHKPGSPELLRAIQATWDLAHRTLQPKFPPGVYKHRSIEDAEKLRAQWEQANFEAYRKRIGKPVSQTKQQLASPKNEEAI